MRTIILNEFTNKEIGKFIDYYKKNKKLPKVIFASVTSKSKKMRLSKLLKELKNDYKTINR